MKMDKETKADNADPADEADKLPAKFKKADWHHVGKANCPDCEGTLAKEGDMHHAYKVRSGRMFTASVSGDPLT